jgi:hypothetical protein
MTTTYRRGMTFQLFERVAAAGPHLRIDEAASCLRGVRVLGLVSGNGRRYAPEGLRASCHLYEGKPCYLGHRQNTREQRPPDQKVGWLENVRPDRDGGLIGDLHLLRSHPFTATVFECAARRPQMLMLSHDAVGREQTGSRGAVIESLVSVSSCDIVSEGATTRSLWEGLDGWTAPAPARSAEAVWRRAQELGLLEARRRPRPADDLDSEAARVAEIQRLRRVGRGLQEGLAPEQDDALRVTEIQRLRRVGRPGGGGVRSLREGRGGTDDYDSEEARAAEVARLRSIR